MNSFDPRALINPQVIESTGYGERRSDIFSALLRERILFLGTPINDMVANLIVGQLLFLDREDPEREIQMYVNSPGGQIYAGLAIYDTMQMLNAPIHTYAVGMTASMGTVLLTAGEPGNRFALPHATIHLHQPLGGAQGQATDIEIHAKEILRLRERLNDILSQHAGQSRERIERDTERDYFLDAPAAAEYGLVDHVLEIEKKDKDKE